MGSRRQGEPALAGQADDQAAAIVAAIREPDVKRLIFITTLFTNDEIHGWFGEWNGQEIGDALVIIARQPT